MDHILYRYYKTILDKLSLALQCYFSCIKNKKYTSIDSSEFISDLINYLRKTVLTAITKESINTNAVNKVNLTLSSLEEKLYSNKDKSFDFSLIIDVFIVLFKHLNKEDETKFNNEFIISILKELKLIRNLFFHSVDISDEIVFRFFENIYHFFKLFTYPNIDYAYRLDLYDFKNDKFLLNDFNFAFDCLKLNVSNVFRFARFFDFQDLDDNLNNNKNNNNRVELTKLIKEELSCFGKNEISNFYNNNKQLRYICNDIKIVNANDIENLESIVDNTNNLSISFIDKEHNIKQEDDDNYIELENNISRNSKECKDKSLDKIKNQKKSINSNKSNEVIKKDNCYDKEDYKHYTNELVTNDDIAFGDKSKLNDESNLLEETFLNT